MAEAAITLSGGPAQPIGFLAGPTFGLVASPTLIGRPNAGKMRLARAAVERITSSPAHGATGVLQLFESLRDELSALRPRSVTAVSFSSLALTVTGAITA